MFRIIGATVVYGFAFFGLIKWLEKSKKDDEENADKSVN